MILYVIGFIITLIILFYIFIKIKYKFWTIQPVFHFYDVHYWFKNIGIINKELPNKNKYTNFLNIETVEFEKLTNKQYKQFIFIIQQHYLKNGNNAYSPKKENITPYFTGHAHKTFFSFYYEKNLLENLSSKDIVSDKKLIGVMNSRPLNVLINNTNNKNKNIFDVYYVDFLCVDKMYRRKNIAPQIIQTHEYNQSHQNKKISVSLFKREGVLTGIVPICVYKTYGFDMKKWSTPNSLPHYISVLTADQQNFYYIYNFIKDISDKWKIVIIPHISNLMELIKTKNIFIKFIMIDGEIKSVYFFRDTCTYINKKEKILSCFASIQGDISDELFINGFKTILSSIVKENIFYFLSIEDISDNNIIITNLKLKSHPIIVSPTAYFFYNFAYETFHSNKVFIVN
jgi:hypothetical protein